MKNQRPQLSDEFFQVPKKEKQRREKKKIEIKLTKKQTIILSVVLCLLVVITVLNLIKVPINYSYLEEKFHVGYNEDSGVCFAAWYPDGTDTFSGYDPRYDIVDEANGMVYESYYIALEVSLFHRIFVPDGYYALLPHQEEPYDMKFYIDGTYLHGEPIHEGGIVGRIYYRDGDGTDHIIWENEALADIEE